VAGFIAARIDARIDILKAAIYAILWIIKVQGETSQATQTRGKHPCN
jgi:hypothetical protein